MQRYYLWAKALAVVVGGMSGFLLLGAGVCESDPFGVLTQVFGPEVRLPQAASCLKYGSGMGICLAVILVAAVSLVESMSLVPLARRPSEPRGWGSLNPAISGTTR